MEQAKKYLELLDPQAKKFLFACFDYRKIKKGKTFYGTYPQSEKLLEGANKETYCIYVTVNETSAGSRRKEDITRCRAIWVEDDSKSDKPRTDWPVEPSLVVESSENKYHYYWFTSTTKFEEWDGVMETMVTKYGCDNKAKDLARVLRLPGYIHKKYLDKPFTCRIVKQTDVRYTWLQIKSIFPPAKKAVASSPEANSTKYSEEATLKSLLNSDNYHGSLASIAMSLTNRGVSREMQYTTLFGLMNAIPLSKRREEWEARASEEHLYECIDSAIRKFEKEDVSETVKDIVDSDKLVENIVFPPGLAGTLCQQIYDMSPYPNKAIAMSGAIGLIAGIAGRYYNVMGMGLNVYIAILADSGIGKAALKDSVNYALRSGGGLLNTGATFVGRSRFTGPKAIFDMLLNGLSRICIMEEAGLMNESTAGDGAGISRVTLDLFTSSGMGKYAGDEGYSSKDNSIPAIHSPALSIVSVSTPKSFLASLKSKSAEVSGEVARLWMIRTNIDKPYLNRNRLENFSKEVLKRIGEIIKECFPYQSAETELKVFNIRVDPDYYDDADKWVDLENKYKREGDHLRRTLCSRAFAKVVKIASVVSVFNGKDHVGKEEYQWAHDSVKQELTFIQDTFTHESSDDMLSVCKNIVTPIIVKIISGKFIDKKKVPSKELMEKGIFTPMNVNQALKNNHVMRTMDDGTDKPNPKTGMDKALDYMVRQGYLVKLDSTKMLSLGVKNKVGYRITSDFKLMAEDRE